MDKSDGTDPNKSIVVIDDNGDLYLLTKDAWTKGEKITDPGRAFLPNQVRQSGGLISFIGRDLVGPGIGAECTIVNLQAILKNIAGESAGSSGTPGAERGKRGESEATARAPHEHATHADKAGKHKS
jgi:hypothetical protein